MFACNLVAYNSIRVCLCNIVGPILGLNGGEVACISATLLVGADQCRKKFIVENEITACFTVSLCLQN